VNQILAVFYQTLFLVIDLATIGVALAAIYLTGKAVYVMVSTRTLQATNLLIVPILLALFALGLQELPALYMRATWQGLEKARPEAMRLQTELRLWVPTREYDDQAPGASVHVEQPILINPPPPLPEFTATPDPNQGGGGPEWLPEPLPTQTPWIIRETAVPVAPVAPTQNLPPTQTPAPTPLPTFDPGRWNPATPPPTPPVTPRAGGS
jgi:hypothetical protein